MGGGRVSGDQPRRSRYALAGWQNSAHDRATGRLRPGLEGVLAFTTEIAEPDRDGGALRYRGVDIEDLVSHRVTFGDDVGTRWSTAGSW